MQRQDCFLPSKSLSEVVKCVFCHLWETFFLHICRTHCNSQVLSQKELCDERLAAAKLEFEKKLSKLASAQVRCFPLLHSQNQGKGLKVRPFQNWYLQCTMIVSLSGELSWCINKGGSAGNSQDCSKHHDKPLWVSSQWSGGNTDKWDHRGQR